MIGGATELIQDEKLVSDERDERLERDESDERDARDEGTVFLDTSGPPDGVTTLGA